jgi:hypothetical protein
MWASDPWQNSSYCWVVICKNVKAHNSENMMVGHKIPLAETDAFESLSVSGPFLVLCDECGEEHSYDPEDVRGATAMVNRRQGQAAGHQ